MTTAEPAPGRPRDPSIDVAVLATARRHLATVGYDAMSLVAVAEEANMSESALRSKSRLLLWKFQRIGNDFKLALGEAG